LIFEKIAKGKAVNAEASQAMINILLDQKFNEIIPALLPAGVKVAHKTGSITHVHHDSGIVILPDGRRYVLVLLSKDWDDEKLTIQTMANISLLIYKYVTAK
jgi:beta-lactamase class A